MFKDEAEIEVWAGKGGDGCASMRREKFVPRGGPDGGDGGRGGHVVLRAQEKVGSLLNLVRVRKFRAKGGRPGEGGNRTGRMGPDLTIPVPIGTLVRDGVTRAVLRDLAHLGDEVIVCKGGNGGRGNRSMASSLNRCPKTAQRGFDGDYRSLSLELKLIADVGIVGLPNAGKSTFLSRVSAARPKIASYPFTTLVPQLGIVDLGNYETLLLADVPGLIEGAFEGHGLGDRFLRHVERTRALIHLVDVSPDANPGPAEAYRIVRKEIGLFREDMVRKPEVVVANKIDMPGHETGLSELREACGQDVVGVSTLVGSNLKTVLGLLKELVDEAREIEKKNPSMDV